MSAFSDWLADTEQRRVLLAEITAYSGGSVVTRHMGSETFNAGDTIYRQRIVGDPSFSRQMSEAFSGRSFVSVGTLELSNIDGGLDSWIDDSFDGRAIVLKLGSPDWSISQFETILTGVIKGLTIDSDETLSLVIKDQSQKLNKPIQPNLFDDGERTEQPLPLCYGYAYNVTPVKVPLGTSPETYTYQVHDGAVEDVCVQLYDKGKISAIGVTKDNASGTFTLASEPEGEATCDVQGSKPSAWLETPGEIFTAIASAATLDSTSLTALDVAAPYQLGIYIDQQTNTIDVLDQLLPAGWWWGDTRAGSIVAYLLTGPGTPVMVIDNLETQGDLQIERLELPTWRTKLGYKLNYTTNTNPDDTTETDRKEFLKNEYRSVSAEDTSVQTTNLDALDPEQYQTFITTESDAQTECNRLLSLFKVQRYLYTVDCFVGPFQLDIGDTVTLKDNRFGLSAGVDCVVVGITEYYLDNRITLVLWR